VLHSNAIGCTIAGKHINPDLVLPWKQHSLVHLDTQMWIYIQKGFLDGGCRAAGKGHTRKMLSSLFFA
jgi:hypothetical protein